MNSVNSVSEAKRLPYLKREDSMKGTLFVSHNGGRRWLPDSWLSLVELTDQGRLLTLHYSVGKIRIRGHELERHSRMPAWAAWVNSGNVVHRHQPRACGSLTSSGSSRWKQPRTWLRTCQAIRARIRPDGSRKLTGEGNMERPADLELRRNTSMEKLDTKWSWNKVGTSPNSIPILSQAALIPTACRMGQPGTRLGQVGTG
jgi:hypothetical protein